MKTGLLGAIFLVGVGLQAQPRIELVARTNDWPVWRVATPEPYTWYIIEYSRDLRSWWREWGDLTYLTDASGYDQQAPLEISSGSPTALFFRVRTLATWAPQDIHGRSVAISITGGLRPFAPLGAYQIAFATVGNTYVLTSMIGGSTGRWSYARTGPGTATLELWDSLVGHARGSATFISPKAGTLHLIQVGGAGYQDSNFILQ